MVIAAVTFIVLFVGFNVFNHTPSPLPSQLLLESAIHLQNIPQKNTDHVEVSKRSTQQAIKPVPIAKKMHSNKDTLKSALTIKEEKNVEVSKTQTIVSYYYTFTAITADVWLQLHDSKEPPALIREALLKKGESMQVTYPKALRLTSGNALSLKITLNHKIIVHANQLGEKGKVLRNYLLK